MFKKLWVFFFGDETARNHEKIRLLENYVLMQTDTIGKLTETVAEIAQKIDEDRAGINELGSLITYSLQQQAEISTHIGLTEAVRQGKILPGMFRESDDDLLN